VFLIKNFQKKKADKEEYKTFLNEDNDTEGLAYDPQTQALWIACKADPFPKKSPKSVKAIYSFDLPSKTLEENPIFIGFSESDSLGILLGGRRRRSAS